MKTKFAKKLIVLVLVFEMVFSYFTALIGTSEAANVDYGWSGTIGRYLSFVALNRGVGDTATRSLFLDLDNTQTHMNDLYCVRSGSALGSTYRTVDLFNIKSNTLMYKGQPVYNALFESDEDYNQLMWILENMYVPGNLDSNELANWPNQQTIMADSDELNRFNQLIDGTSPFADNETVYSKYLDGRAGGVTVSKNVMLLKAVQNEILTKYIKNSYDVKCNPDLNSFYHRDAYGNTTELTDAEKAYVQKMVNTLTANHTDFDVDSSLSKDYTNNNGEFYLEKEGEADAENHRSLTFKMKNPARAELTSVDVYINGELANASQYKFIKADNNEEINLINVINSGAAKDDFYKFKVEYNGEYTGEVNVKIVANIKFNNITKATLLLPFDGQTQVQTILNLERKSIEKQVSSESVAKPKIFDLALTKQIIDANGKERNRLKKITLGGLDVVNGERSATNAKYYMDKSQVEVYLENSDKVIYRITVYNEGQIDGYAEEITDYLPKQLELTANSTINSKYGWTQDSIDPQKYHTDYLSKAKSEDNILRAYENGDTEESFKSKSKYVEIECTIKQSGTGAAQVDDCIDNRAEISKYGYYTEQGTFMQSNGGEGTDVDSLQNNVLAKNQTVNAQALVNLIEDEIENATNYQEKDDDKNKISYEDDDDIERIIIKENNYRFDLALRKWIYKVNSKEDGITEYSNTREPDMFKIYERHDLGEINSYAYDAIMGTKYHMVDNTFVYNHDKMKVNVKIGDKVIYRIAIFNEGYLTGYANEVTDYLPNGLELVSPEESEINRENGWKVVTDSTGNPKKVDGATVISTRKLAYNPINIHDNMINNLLDAYTNSMSQKDYGTEAVKVLEVECIVTDAVEVNKPITNRAEITEYGYVKNGQFVQCNQKGVDLDSEQKTIGTATNPLNLQGWYYGTFDEDQPQEYVKGEQDDDDFETIYVQALDGKQNLELYKVDSNNKPINPENIGRLFEVKMNDENWNKQTSEGNKVTYETKYIRSTGTDTITIKEVESPKGYAKFDYTIKLYTERFLEGGTYKSKITKIELIEKDGTTVHATYESTNPETFKEIDVIKEGQKVVGKRYRVDIEGGAVEFTTLGSISVTVQDKKIDVALMKSISKISNDNGTTFKDVTLANNFNAGRYAAEDLISVNENSLKNSTNAKYSAEKTPVEIKKGDVIEYQIRLYNEGEVPAGAQEIKDYLPTGLEFVQVYYANEEEHLEQGDSTPNQNTYKCENNTLTIYLNNVNLIPAYVQGEGVKYNYVRVQCRVTENATGILTNVAEISKYYNNNKELIDDDIDSTANNWQAPSTDRASDDWRNYSNNQDCTTRHEFVSQRTVNPNGDDDDFDKLIVKGDYKVTITKQNESGEEIRDIPFTIKRQKDGTEETLADNVQASSFPFEDTFSTTQNSEIVYLIREGENALYDQLKNDLSLAIHFENGTMKNYAIRCGNTQYGVTTDGTHTYNFESKMGGQIEVTINFNSAENKIDIIIKNTELQEGKYSVKVRKVSAEDPTKALSGVIFEGKKGITQNSKDFYGQPEYFETEPTNASGITSIQDDYEITNDNYTVVDKYKITEINLGSNNTAYTKLNTSIAVFVTKKYNSRTAKYEMKDWAVTIDGENYTTTSNKVFNGNGKVIVDENNLRYTITATEQNGIITVTIPNMPDMPTYLNITKIDKDTNQPIQGVKMQATIPTSGIGWLDYTNENGLFATHTNISADTTSIEYRIKEIDAAPGYDNVFYGKYIKLVVGLNNGTITGITEAKVYNVADDTEDTTLNSPDWFSASIDSQNSSQINLIMKNPITEKVVDLALKKVIVEVDGKQVKPNTFDNKYDRITGDEVDTTPLDNGKNDAIYNLNKTPVLVQKGSKVKYQIRIYNESDEIDATASKIKDYLPTGLKLVNVYYNDNTLLTRNTDYTYDETNNVLETNILANKELIAKYVPGNGTTQGTISYDYITVECEVQEAAQGVLTNVAQITEYTTLDRDENRVTVPDDRDSHSDNWVNPNGDANNDRTDKGTPAWSDYSGDEGNNIEEGVFKDYPGQEDDDDFEKIVVGEVDLVLKKIITKIGDKTEDQFDAQYKRFQNGNVNVDPTRMNTLENVTTAEYNLNKTTIPVKKNDIVTYQIRIYNEGNIDATATEIKDYIPKGMSFIKAYYNGQELSSGSDYTVDHNTNVLTITALEDLIPAYTGTGTPSYDDKLTIECKVDGDEYGILTNVAEISEYTTFYGVTNIDRDSQTDGTGEWQAPLGKDKLTKEGKAGEAWARYYHIYTKGVFKDYPGQQDDDDFEKVVIQPEYKFRLKKINAMDHSQVLSGVKFEIENQDYVTGEDGYTDYVTKELISSGLNFYIIRETELKDGFIGLRHGYHPSYGADHTEYSGTIAFGVIGQETGSGEIELTEYRFEAKTGNLNNGVRVPLNKTSFVNTYTAKDVDNNDVEIKVHVIYNNENGQYAFEIEIENTLADDEYPIFLKKVDKNG